MIIKITISKNMDASKNFYNNLKDNPDKIIQWCKEEIAEYKKLIQLIQKMQNKNKK